MAECPNALDSKSGIPITGIGGLNPSLSASIRMVPTHVDVANREHKRKVQNYGKEKDLYKRGTVGKNAEKDEQVRGMVFL